MRGSGSGETVGRTAEGDEYRQGVLGHRTGAQTLLRQEHQHLHRLQDLHAETRQEVRERNRRLLHVYGRGPGSETYVSALQDLKTDRGRSGVEGPDPEAP